MVYWKSYFDAVCYKVGTSTDTAAVSHNAVENGHIPGQIHQTFSLDLHMDTILEEHLDIYIAMTSSSFDSCALQIHIFPMLSG